MADERFSVQFDDVPREQARRVGHGPRMEPMLYETLRQKIASLSTEAVRIHLGPELTPQRMRNYLLRIARDLDVPVTIRRVPGGVSSGARPMKTWSSPKRSPSGCRALNGDQREGDVPVNAGAGNDLAGHPW